MLLFGGPYGNRQALDALFDAARQLDIPAKRMLCTGDLAAYAAEPQAVVDRIRDANITVVMGNVEESLGTAAADCHCGFEEGSACDLMAAQWYRYAVDAVSEDAKSWMRTLPRRADFRLGGRASPRFTAASRKSTGSSFRRRRIKTSSRNSTARAATRSSAAMPACRSRARSGRGCGTTPV